MIKLKLMTLIILLFSSPIFAASSKAIYGVDNRYETNSTIGQEFRHLARAVSIQIPRSRLYREGGKYWFNAGTFKQAQNLCANVPYAEEKVIGECSGVLIATDLILTAGHCLEQNSPCKNSFWSFDFHKEKATRGYLRRDEVYSCARIVHRENDSLAKIDFAVIKLDRAVVGIEPVTLSRSFYPTNEALFMIGHPNGVSAKIAFNGNVISSGLSEANTFRADLDAFVINSGSPVFNAKTQEVEGILIRGIQDFTYNRFDQCNELNICQSPYSAQCSGETVLKASVVRQLIEN